MSGRASAANINPPISNRGVPPGFFEYNLSLRIEAHKMSKQITHCIDWLQYSVEWPNQISEWPINRTAEMALARTAVPQVGADLTDWKRPDDETPFGMQGYSKTYDMKYASVHVNPQRREQKLGVRMTGKELGAYRDFGGTETKLIDFLTGCNASTSRIDIAYDLFGYNVDLQRIYADWKAGKVTTKARTVRPMTQGQRNEKGEIEESTTLYFGSRQSEIMVRMYEKGKEQRVDIDWLRVELEIKGDRAKAIVRDCYANGVDIVGRQLLRHFIPSAPYKFYAELLKTKSVELTAMGRKKTEREIWLHNVVFPVLRDEIAREWESCEETGITREVEALVREHWTTRAIAIKKQYNLL